MMTDPPANFPLDQHWKVGRVTLVTAGTPPAHDFEEQWLDGTKWKTVTGGMFGKLADDTAGYLIGGGRLHVGDLCLFRSAATVDPEHPSGIIVEMTPLAAGDGAGDCSSCAWLKWVPTTGCWTMYRRGGDGRCGCWADEDPADEFAGIRMVYVAGLSGWLAVKNNQEDELGDAMANTCCGCGEGLFQVSAGVPSFTLGGVHVSCQGDPPAVFTETLTDYCCGLLPDGRRFVEFFGSSADACTDPDLADCDNTYRVMVACGDPCPPPECGCQGCGTNGSPIVWYGTVSGFDDAHWNGDWVLRINPGTNCLWEGACGGHESGLTYVGSGTPSWQLSHGGETFAVAVADNDCTGSITLLLVGGPISGVPDSITLTAVQGVGDSVVCCGEHLAIDPDEFPTLTATFTDKTGACACLPDSDTLTYDAMRQLWVGTMFSCLAAVCEENADPVFGCSGGEYQYNSADLPGVSPVSFVLSPLLAVYDKTIGGGSYRVTITE